MEGHSEERLMTTSLMQCKVLVVEDIDENRSLMRQLLGRLGVTVLEAVDGRQGLEMARREQPDLILMDLSLPVIDGWEATRLLKANPATRDIPVVAVTAHALKGDEVRARAVGCDGYVSKPLDVVAFGQYVSELLQRDDH
jgi:two-component system cell cycle response regulator DivK